MASQWNGVRAGWTRVALGNAWAAGPRGDVTRSRKPARPSQGDHLVRRSQQQTKRAPRAALRQPSRSGIATVATRPLTPSARPYASPRLVRLAGMTIDSDGASRAADRNDRTHSTQTSMNWGGGRYVDASTIPYVVATRAMLRNGVHLGDLAKVTVNGKSVYGIVADVGGTDVGTRLHGEVSVEMARLLGVGHDAVNSGIEAPIVRYEVMRGSGRPLGCYNGSPLMFTAAQIQCMGAEAFDDYVPTPRPRPDAAGPRPELMARLSLANPRVSGNLPL